MSSETRPEEAPLHDDVRLLASTLGAVIRRLEGEESFRAVEELRRACRARRRQVPNAPTLDDLLARVDALPLDHAAVVARGMGKCAIVGAKDVEVDLTQRCFAVNGSVSKVVLGSGLSSLELAQIRNTCAAILFLGFLVVVAPARLRVGRRELLFLVAFGLIGGSVRPSLFEVGLGRELEERASASVVGHTKIRATISRSTPLSSPSARVLRRFTNSVPSA